MLGQVGPDLVEGARGDLGAVAQSRYQLAVVDDEPPERGFSRAGRTTIIPDFSENLVGGLGGGAILVFPGPHGDLLRFSSLDRDQATAIRMRQPQSEWAEIM